MIAAASHPRPVRRTSWRVERWEGDVFLAACAGHLLVQLMPTFRAWLGLA